MADEGNTTMGDAARAAFSPIFVVGVQRSGTTMLNAVLNRHPAISMGYECGFYRRLHEAFGDGVPVKEPGRGAFLDALFAVRRFEHWKLERAAVAGALEAAGGGPDGDGLLDYSAALEAIARLHRDTHKPAATRMGFKNPHGIYHIPFILDLFPAAQILHVIRDPRGVLNSEQEKATKARGARDPLMPWTVIQRYRRMQTAHGAALHEAGAARYHALYYADLVTDFDATARGVLDFLGLPWGDFMHTADPGAIPDAERWQHARAQGAMDHSRLLAFRETLSREELGAVEHFCRADIAALPGGAFYASPLERWTGAARLLGRKAFGRRSAAD